MFLWFVSISRYLTYSTHEIIANRMLKIAYNVHTQSSNSICLNILSDQNYNCSDSQQFWSENVRCPTAISSTAFHLMQNENSHYTYNY